jgi:hypothetical protein
MERKDRKRKAVEIAESPLLVSERISELAAELKECDTKLRKVIGELRGEVGSLKTQLAEKTAECESLGARAAFLHPDAVIDRVRMKLWHHGDLSLLRRVIDPHTRVLRNTEGRLDRSLSLFDTPPKKAGVKASANAVRTGELSPKHESEEPTPATADAVATTDMTNMDAEEKQQEVGPHQEEGQQQQEGGEGEPQEEQALQEREQVALFAAPADSTGGPYESLLRQEALNDVPVDRDA